MATTTIASTGEQIKSRVERGRLFYEEHGHLIEDQGDGTYLVPSRSRNIVHEVDIETESCSCEDYAFFGSEHDVGCFHVFAVAIKEAHEAAARYRATRKAIA